MSNPWILHLNQFRADNPGLSFKQCLRDAAGTYKRPGKERKEEAQDE